MTSTLVTKAPSQSSLVDLPLIVNEDLVHKFTYWNHRLETGMLYGSELYTLHHSYPIEERLKACDAGCEQTLKGIHVCITVSKATYSVWLGLRSMSTNLVDSTDYETFIG